MARTIFVTKQYVNGQINSEANARITADTAIENDINTQSSKIAVNATGIAGLRKIQEMYKVEREYIAPRDTKFLVTIPETNTVLASAVLNKDPQENIPRNTIPNPANIGRISFTGGGFRLRR